MKKLLAFTLALAMLAIVLTGCSSPGQPHRAHSGSI